MAEGTPVESASGTRAPDDLKWRGPEDDDSQLVTEPLSRMQPWMHRALAAWFALLVTVTLAFMRHLWPEPPERHWRAEVESLQTVVRQVQAVESLSVVDSVKASLRHRLLTRAQSDSTAAAPEPIKDVLLFEIALLCGILGASAHGLASLMDFRGQRRLFRSWGLWYFALPVLGGVMAVIFFLLLRAGLFPDAKAADAFNPFGVGAIAALAGLCTDKATTRLAQVLDTLFLAKGPDREGKLNP